MRRPRFNSQINFNKLRNLFVILVGLTLCSWVVLLGCRFNDTCITVYACIPENNKKDINYEKIDQLQVQEVEIVLNRPKLIMVEESSELEEVIIPAASTADFSWINLSENWKLFSAYVDKRLIKIAEGVFERSVVTMGYEKGPATNVIQCVVVWADRTRSILKHYPQRAMISEQWRKKANSFRSYFYRCNITGSQKSPRFITLIEKNSTDINTIPRSAFVPVVDADFPLIYEFGVCFQTPLFGVKYKQIVIDSIEMNKILGAQLFTLYVHDGAESTIKTLKSYTEQGILDGVYNWADNIPFPTYMRGVLVGMQDCLYRNMYKAKYLAFCDFDEVITPKQHINWHDLMKSIKPKKWAYFSFNHLAFHTNHTESAVSHPCPGKPNLTYKTPHFLATRNRSVNVFRNSLQAKAIVNAKLQLFLHVHNRGSIMKGYYNYYVPKDLGLLQHFRDKDDPRYTKYNSTVDNNMSKFKTPLLKAVIEKVCKVTHYIENRQFV